MTLNHTRFSDASLCWRKTFNKYHRRLAGGFSVSRTDGVAYHAGVAHALATENWDEGIQVARQAFEREVEGVALLPQEQYVLEDNWDCTLEMINLYRRNFEGEDMQIVAPECEFKVDLEERGHNCIWRHWLDRETAEEHFDAPPADLILAGRVMSPHARPSNECTCWSRHQVVGKIDGIWKWKNALWINDHKSTALHPDGFWSQWDLNYQPRIYIYGAMKSLGVRPHGFIINAIFKPSEAQVSAWNSRRKNGPPQTPKDYLKYERQAFPTLDEDVERVRRDLLARAVEWEWRIQNGFFPLSPPPGGACRMYNKDCEFKPLCTTHDSEDTLAGYTVRTDYDYVEKELFQIGGAK